MKLEVAKEKGVTLLRVKENRLYADQVLDFADRVSKHVHDLALVINFDDVDVIDSRGLGALFELIRKRSDMQIAIGVCCLNRHVGEAIKLVRLDKMVDVFTDETTALNALAEKLQAARRTDD